MNGTDSILSTETDVVCRMEIDKRKVELSSGRKGTMNYFRSLSSKREFDKSPEKCINFYGPGR